MKSNQSRLFCLFVSGLFLYSCSKKLDPIYHYATPPTVPLFTEAKETQIESSVYIDGLTLGGKFSLAHSFTDKWGGFVDATINHSVLANSLSTNSYSWGLQVGGIYYNSNYTGLIYGVTGSLAFGVFANEFSLDSSDTRFTEEIQRSEFLQVNFTPYIGTRTKGFELSAAITFQNHTLFTRNDEFFQHAYSNRYRNSFCINPSISMAFGFRFFKFKMQYSHLNNVSNPDLKLNSYGVFSLTNLIQIRNRQKKWGRFKGKNSFF